MAGLFAGNGSLIEFWGAVDETGIGVEIKIRYTGSTDVGIHTFLTGWYTFVADTICGVGESLSGTSYLARKIG